MKKSNVETASAINVGKTLKAFLKLKHSEDTESKFEHEHINTIGLTLIQGEGMEIFGRTYKKASLSLIQGGKQ